MGPSSRFRGGKGARDIEVHTLDSKHGTNVTKILSGRRFRASTMKVDAPLVMEKVPELAGPRVVSPVVRSLTKMVKKHIPMDPDRLHQSATLQILHGGAGRVTQICAKMGVWAYVPSSHRW